MSLRLLVPLVLVVFGLGFLLGRHGERIVERAVSGTRTPRPAALERAWRALESGDRAALVVSASELDAETQPTAAYRAEAHLIRAISTGDRVRVRALADAGRDAPLGAQALAWLIDTAADQAERAKLEALLAERYPTSWRVREPAAERDR